MGFIGSAGDTVFSIVPGIKIIPRSLDVETFQIVWMLEIMGWVLMGRCSLYMELEVSIGLY